MKNIYIPKKFFIVLLIFAIAMMLIGLFTSCSTESCRAEALQDNKRFQLVYKQDTQFYIILDKETNQKYLVVNSMYGTGLTKLEE